MSSQVLSITQRLGTNIRAARLSAGLKQRELAGLAGVDVITVSRWERGAHSPSEANLAAMAGALGRDIGWFYVDHSMQEAA